MELPQEEGAPHEEDDAEERAYADTARLPDSVRVVCHDEVWTNFERDVVVGLVGQDAEGNEVHRDGQSQDHSSARVERVMSSSSSTMGGRT